MPQSNPSFRVFRLHGPGDGQPARLESVTLNEIAAGDVLIRTQYSSVNYKDALAGTGRAKIARRLPLVGGIDVAGQVVASEVPDFQEGDEVLVTGCGLSEVHDGGYADYVRVPSEWVIPVPEGLSPYQVMALGTAGFTAGLALQRLEDNHQTPANGPIAVTGATGGVGSFALDLLSASGYEVTAITGKSEADAYLKQLGATQILGRQELEMGNRPLEPARWGGAIDNVGGELLAWFTRTVHPWGNIASIGLAGGTEVHTTVMPFILRGVSLIGITSANCPRALREHVWQRLASDLRPPHLEQIVTESVTLEQLPEVFERMLAGQTHGRIVVRLDEA